MLSGVKLSGVELFGVKLPTIKLSGVKLFGVKLPTIKLSGVKLSAVFGIWCWWCGELRVGMVSGGDLKKMPETESSPSSPHRNFLSLNENKTLQECKTALPSQY